MKNIALSLLTLLSFALTNRVSAQSVAHLNYQEIIQMMPEYKIASDEYDIYRASLEDKLADIEKKAMDIQKKMETERAKPAPSTTKMNVFTAQLQAIQVEYQEEQQGIEDSLKVKLNDLVDPIKKKIEAVVAQIAKEKGYTHVIDVSVTYMLYADPAYDITQQVKDKLGLKNKPATGGVKPGVGGMPRSGGQR